MRVAAPPSRSVRVSNIRKNTKPKRARKCHRDGCRNAPMWHQRYCEPCKLSCHKCWKSPADERRLATGNSLCAVCHTAKALAWNKSNRSQHRSLKKTYTERCRQRDPAGYRVLRRVQPANSKAKKRGVEGTFSPSQWCLIVERQGGKCNHCGSATELTIDHIIPLASPASTNWPDNIQGLCLSCNLAKGDRPWEEFHPVARSA